LKNNEDHFTEQEMLDSLSLKERQDFFEICCGRRYPSLMSDIIAKTCFDPDVHPERLEFLLRRVVADDSIIVKGSFGNEAGAGFTDAKRIIFDIPARLDDGRLSDTEFQIAKQDFALRRGDLYGSELLAIQYSAGINRRKSDIDYDTVDDVILVFLLKDSPDAFIKFDSEHYIHRFKKYTADTGFSYTPLVTTIYVQIDKALEQFKNGIDGERDSELQLLLAMMGDMNDPSVRERLDSDFDNRDFFVNLAEQARQMTLDKEVQAAMLSEKFYYMDLNSIKHYEHRTGYEEGIEQGIEQFITSLLRNGKTPEEIHEFCDIPLEEIMAIQKI